MNINSSIRNRIMGIVVMFMIFFAAVGFAEPSHAAVPKAPAKVTLKSAALVKGSEQTQVKITWKKINGVSGYQIARKDGNGSWKNIKNVNKAGTVTFTNTGLKASTKYTYRVRAYKTYKQYYNTTTKKWVNSKPSAKNWKGKKTKTAYKYGKWSETKAITTKAKLGQTISTDTDIATVYVNNSFSLNAKTTSKLTLTYSSSNTKVATVTSGGKVTAKGVGTATITINQSGNAVYKTASKKITVNVIAAPSGSGEGSGSNADPGSGNQTPTTLDNYSFPVHENIKLAYNGTTIHLGQTWSDSIALSLGPNTSFIRKNGAIVTLVQTESGVTIGGSGQGLDERKFDTTLYLYDTTTYRNFLVVYVANNQIIKWTTCMQNMGSINSTNLTRGNTDYSISNINVGMTDQYELVTTKNGILFGGFKCEGYTESRVAPQDINELRKEKRIGLHFVNAWRVLNGEGICEYHQGLDGENNTWSGTYKVEVYDLDEKNELIDLSQEYTVENIRYGAQPWAESMRVSNYVGHSTAGFSAGPLQGVTNEAYSVAISNMSDRDASCTGTQYCHNCGGLGEYALIGFTASRKHLVGMLRSEFDTVGIGFADVYCCVQFGAAI